jgi:hypothetical protein
VNLAQAWKIHIYVHFSISFSSEAAANLKMAFGRSPLCPINWSEYFWNTFPNLQDFYIYRYTLYKPMQRIVSLFLLLSWVCTVRRVQSIGTALSPWSWGSRLESGRHYFFGTLFPWSMNSLIIVQVHSAFHPSVVDKSKYQLCMGLWWGCSPVEWQVALCDPIDMWFPLVVRCLTWATIRFQLFYRSKQLYNPNKN